MARRAFICLLLCCLPLAGAVAAESDEEAIEILQSLARQTGEIETLRAEFTVTHFREGTDRSFEKSVRYLRSGDRFICVETSPDTSAEEPSVEKRAYNGREVKYLHHAEGPGRSLGIVQPPYAHEQWDSTNAPLSLCGFAWADFAVLARSGDRVFRSFGAEEIEGRRSTKLLATGPFTEGHKAYVYYWIDDEGPRPVLFRTLCLIDDDPRKKLIERSFEYDSSSRFPFPTKLRYERNDVTADGELVPGAIKEVVFKSVEINGPVSDGEFEFEFPNGTMVRDEIAKLTYVVGSAMHELDGEDMAEAVGLDEVEVESEEQPVETPAAAERTPEAEPTSVPNAATDRPQPEDGREVWEIVGLAVVCVLVAFAVTVIIRRQARTRAR